MRIYRIHYWDSDAGDIVSNEWFSNKAKAKKRLNELKREAKENFDLMADDDSLKVEIVKPTKKDIIRLLNKVG